VPLGTQYAQQDCSLARTLEVVGERWTLLILRDCFLGVRRFADFAAHLDISKAVLTERLGSLVDAGLLRTVPRGARHDYVLTERGLSLWPVTFTMTQWGEEHLAPLGRRRVFEHRPCGEELQASGQCSACGQVPGPHEIDSYAGPGARGLRTDAVSRDLRGRRPLLAPVGTGLPHLDSSQEPAESF
jgi:DNA-binding HxlR family transcriptional regulator